MAFQLGPKHREDSSASVFGIFPASHTQPRMILHVTQTLGEMKLARACTVITHLGVDFVFLQVKNELCHTDRIVVSLKTHQLKP